MQLSFYQIDTFTEKVFSGNPAAVCPLDYWLDDELLQAIALENNLSETAFFVPSRKGYHIRWFTPATEVNLCGHATLASAYVIFNYLSPQSTQIKFSSASGPLIVSRENDRIILDFPANPPKACEPPSFLSEALGIEPSEVWWCDDYLVVLDSEEAIRKVKPDFPLIRKLDGQGVIVTARGGEVDFVSRYFAPKVGIDEDPVTGAIHCALIPFWSERLRKNELIARQLSQRGGELYCTCQGERVLIGGYAAEYLQGKIIL